MSVRVVPFWPRAATGSSDRPESVVRFIPQGQNRSRGMPQNREGVGHWQYRNEPDYPAVDCAAASALGEDAADARACCPSRALELPQFWYGLSSPRRRQPSPPAGCISARCELSSLRRPQIGRSAGAPIPSVPTAHWLEELQTLRAVPARRVTATSPN